MGGPARPLHEPGNRRSSERCSHRHSADCGSLIERPTVLRITAPTPRPGARSAVLAMKELWTKDEAEFHGKYYDFPPVISFPKPLQQPHPPIYVGAMTAGNVFRRVMTYGNGWMPWLYTPEQIRDGRAMLDKLAPEFGRDPRSIGVVAAPVTAEPDVVRQYEDAGADRIVVFLMPVVEPEMQIGRVHV